MMIKIPKTQQKKLKYKYLSGKSSENLSKEFKVSVKTILNTLRKIGVFIRGPAINSRKYPINENFFDSIDTQEKAYFLGYLFADGCNSGKRINLNLSEKDLDILKIFNKLIHPKGKPLYKNGPRKSTLLNGQVAHTKTNYHLTIENGHIAQILSSYGCTPRKTNTLDFPKFINPNLIPHFIRGYFDGDGSLCLFGRKPPYINAYISITSTRKFCTEIQKIIKKELNVNSRILEKTYKTENVVEMRITEAKHVNSFLTWIYKNSTIHLKRKYTLFQTLAENRTYLSMPRKQKKCSICNEVHYGKGLCNRHYQSYIRKVKALAKAKEALNKFAL